MKKKPIILLLTALAAIAAALAVYFVPAPAAVASPQQAVVDSAYMRADSLFHARTDSSPSRIYFPKGDTAYLDPAFRAMEQADSTVRRIVYYGDSQLEGDRITCQLREYIQQTFGGSGPGMLAAVAEMATLTMTESYEPRTLRFYRPYGERAWHATHHRYGPRADMTRVDAEAQLTYTTTLPFQRVTVVTGDSVVVTELDSAVTHYTVTIAGPTDVYGVCLDGLSGVAVDNVPGRGSSGINFTQIDSASIYPFFKQFPVPLIIYQFGTNAIPYVEEEAQMNNYIRQVRAQLRLFRRMAPRAKILVVGPPDMSQHADSSYRSYPTAPRLNARLRQLAAAEGCAFWSIYDVMGGEGSMARWAAMKPALSSPDHIHFTGPGAERIGRRLAQTLDLYYRYYQARRAHKQKLQSKQTRMP